MFVFRRQTIELDPLQKEVIRQIAEHKKWYLFEGFLFIVLGILAAALPAITTLAVEAFLAAILLIGGGFRLASLRKIKKDKTWRAVSGLILLAFGGLILFFPLASMAALILLLGGMLVAEGIIEIFLALAFRPGAMWGWLLVAGLVSLVLGGLILFGGIPAGILFVGIMVGLSFALYGISLVLIAWRADKDNQKFKELDHEPA
jgi:uncharacterized membrane protein HdeD (DUF308 family)